MTGGRKIIHVDMDAFFASVEQRDDPSLRGRPVAVGGSAFGRGVVAAASYEARAFGVHSAMPSAEARRLCRHLEFRPPRFDVYRRVSHEIRAIFSEYTALVEPLSLDEAFLDVTQNHKEMVSATLIAQEIKARIRDELNLTASAGVGPNKLVAKIASGMDKPNGLVVVPPQEVVGFLCHLPIEKIGGIGPVTAPRIHRMGAKTIGEITAIPLAEMERKMGSFGRLIHQLARGDDQRPVTPRRPPRSRGAERTFSEDLTDLDSLTAIVRALANDVATSLHAIQRPARTVTLKVRYDDFTTVTRSRTLGHFTWDGVEIEALAAQLISHTEAGARPVRLLGVSASNLYDPEDNRQLELPFGGNASSVGC